ncbi:exodeoxyribonuclease VII large subunit [Fluviicoccus keumensis]|uniref:Exodeoxyribonuclease 7 large subunit n=1 Tax=Fluviicoccus keumensis TaxID=1435465 RepID=A0A4Q7Z5D5_9GAMM|nr:exodeoxyribonuclease VII large subunit [Fluviicoccus keumensis]RZU45234.1 exodeoxyribonuclease VII large subunit [Fluviicoccus keumensis]
MAAQRTYLQVPFPEKDQAKALGARWDPMERKWFVQAEDLSPFKRWMPSGKYAASAEPVTTRHIAEPQSGYRVESADDAKGLSLLDFMLLIQGTVEAVFPQPVWVRAEINQIKVSQGHWFLELVEHDATGSVVASTSGTLWKGNSHVIQRFRQETGVELAEGIKLLLSVQPRFNPRYGLKLDILGIDSAYTLGDMAAKLNRIRDTLKAEGVYLLNKRLPLPMDFLHLAIISPSGAASLGDFRAEADRLARLGICRFTYYETAFQGASAPPAIVQAIARAVSLHERDPVDALVIIRGGGSAADLFWLNDEDLARQVCRCPLPVITGIGHEPDNTILDEVAARRCDTPSKVAQLILTTIHDAVGQAEAAMREIRELAERRMRLVEQDSRHWLEDISTRAGHLLMAREQRVQQDYREIRHAAGMLLARRQDRLDHLMQSCRDAGIRHAEASQTGLEQQWSAIGERSALRLREAVTSCEHLMQVILALGPEKTLKRGYGIVRSGDRVLTHQAELPPGAAFSIQMQDGHIDARRTS